MSSNIKVQRICQHCGNEFTARTTITLYCSHRCNSAAYKQKVRQGKIEKSNKETQRIKKQPIEDLKALEFLTVTQVSKLIGCSRQNVYKLINIGKLRATNILQKKTIVKRSDLDKLFTESTKIVKSEDIPEIQEEIFNLSECYTLTEVQDKYGISETALQNLIKRNSIPKIKKGWFAYIPKTVIDTLLN